MKIKIKDAMPTRKVEMNNYPDKQSWQDKECHHMKQQLKKARREATEDMGKVHIFHKVRKEYRWLIGKKKEEQEIKKWIKAEKDKTKKKFWNLINRQRCKKERISEKIKISEWVKHFKNQMLGVELEEESAGEVNSEKNHEEEKEEEKLNSEEIKKIINEIKNESCRRRQNTVLSMVLWRC